MTSHLNELSSMNYVSAVLNKSIEIATAEPLGAELQALGAHVDGKGASTVCFEGRIGGCAQGASARRIPFC